MKEIYVFLIFICFCTLTANAQDCSSQIKKAMIPRYPAAAIALNESGQVIIEVNINKSGEVLDTKVLNGPKLLGQLSEVTSREWEFSKLKKGLVSKCGNRKTLIFFNYVLLPSDTKPSKDSLSFIVFPNKVEIREIKMDVSFTPTK
ncbi:MAG: TonB family protein [Pyrinomonadaceae bacterium]